MMRTARWVFAVLAAAVLFGATASEAVAAGGYGAVAGQQTGGGGGSTLPFTGFNLLAYIAVAVAIVASGVALRTVSAQRSRK